MNIDPVEYEQVKAEIDTFVQRGMGWLEENDFSISELQHCDELLRWVIKADAVLEADKVLRRYQDYNEPATREWLERQSVKIVREPPTYTPSDRPAQRDTLQLLRDVARHLIGREVEVTIERDWAGAPGVASAYKGVYKITISPDITSDGLMYFSTFCHELAHLKLGHKGKDAQKYDGQFEAEADNLGYRWFRYAEWNRRDWSFAVGPVKNRATADLHARLLSLLNSPTAPDFTLE